MTINKFFENNLNISETARQLYVHRNTLVYRLERIQKILGLDIRTFEDAMLFKIALMVIAHMNYQKNLFSKNLLMVTVVSSSKISGIFPPNTSRRNISHKLAGI